MSQATSYGKSIPALNRERHIKYWLRCLKTLLPTQYTPMDSNRMSLAFFTVSALDILDALETNTTASERQEYIDWVYLNQHDDGGFRAWTGASMGSRASSKNKHWDPANMSATYFAVAILLILGDDLSRVRRRECLAWLRMLQRPSGAFGETLVDGIIQGGHDARFGYCAAGISYILQAQYDLSVDEQSRLSKDDFVRYIRSAQTYDGGIADLPYHESHAGFTFCALAALDMFDRLAPIPNANTSGVAEPARTLSWLASRQTDEIYQQDEVDQKSELDSVDQYTYIGYNGRCNKVADTCYAFWVTASLAVLGRRDLVDQEPLRRWLLTKTAHDIIGGFGKHAGDRPDLHHSYLGLAALALQNCPDDGLQPLDAAMCISKRAKERLRLIWHRWEGIRPDLSSGSTCVTI